MPMPMTKSKTAKIKTEMGFDIKVLPSERQAEFCAKLKEDLEVRQSNYDKALDQLKVTLRDEKRVFVNAKGTAGTLYRFDVKASEEKIRVSKPKTGA